MDTRTEPEIQSVIALYKELNTLASTMDRAYILGDDELTTELRKQALSTERQIEQQGGRDGSGLL